MKAKDILSALRNITKPPEKLPDWPLSETVIRCLLADPQASAKYMDDRLNHQFSSRDEIGAHINWFIGASGISRGNLSALNKTLGLQVKRTKLTESRQAQAAEVQKHRQQQAKAVCAVVSGVGTPRSLEDKLGVGYRSIYRLLKEELGVEGIVLEDLKRIATPRRKALAKKIEKRMFAQIEADYAHRLTE